MVLQDHQQLYSAVICESILQMVTEDPTISVSVLIAHIRYRYTFTTTYRKTWIVKQKAIERIYNNWEKSYKELPRWIFAFKHYLPDTVTDIEVGPFIEDGQRVPSKIVFHHLFLEFPTMYQRYRGTLLMAIAQDGDDHTIPIAYAIVEGETSDAWFFFLSRLRMFVTPQPNLCLISDRHESIKSDVRRGTHNLPTSSLVQAIYYIVTAKFEERGTQGQAMMTSGLIYSNTIIQNLNKELAMSNSHEVVIHNRAHSIFIVKELVRPPSSRPVGTFKVDLDKRWCDCDEFQALHYPCLYVIAACSFIHCGYMMYVSSKYTLQCIFDVYKEEFPAIPLQSYWLEYNGIESCHNPAMRRDPKGRPQLGMGIG
ncbi:uncharacterized protein [Cicer arietinum]|uniref:uncharacterized protein n=1 Tax=Cicer arietinum TaxID=3827 RepID=UPI003CC506B2